MKKLTLFSLLLVAFTAKAKNLTQINFPDTDQARSHHVMVSLGDKVFIWGGQYTEFLGQTVVYRHLNTGRVFDKASMTWGKPTSTINAPSPRMRAVGQKLPGNRVLVLGGCEVVSGGSSSTACSQVARDSFIYDLDTDTWTRLPDTSLLKEHNVSKPLFAHSEGKTSRYSFILDPKKSSVVILDRRSDFLFRLDLETNQWTEHKLAVDLPSSSNSSYYKEVLFQGALIFHASHWAAPYHTFGIFDLSTFQVRYFNSDVVDIMAVQGMGLYQNSLYLLGKDTENLAVFYKVVLDTSGILAAHKLALPEHHGKHSALMATDSGFIKLGGWDYNDKPELSIEYFDAEKGSWRVLSENPYKELGLRSLEISENFLVENKSVFVLGGKTSFMFIPGPVSYGFNINF